MSEMQQIMLWVAAWLILGTSSGFGWWWLSGDKPGMLLVTLYMGYFCWLGGLAVIAIGVYPRNLQKVKGPQPN